MTRNGGPANMPVYLQIREQIYWRIVSGQYRPGDKLPSEEALARAHGVSRMTVTKALQELVDREYLRRVQGGGTYVGKPTIEGNRNGIRGLTRTMTDRGYRLQTRVLEQTVCHPPRPVADALGMPLGRKVLHLKRLRIVNGSPVVLQDTWVDQSVCPEPLDTDFTRCSLYDRIREHTGMDMHQARDRMEAVAADEAASGLLGVDAGFPLLLVRRVASLSPGRPVEYAESLYRSDQYVMEITY